MEIFAQLFSTKEPLSERQNITLKFHQVLGVWKLKENFEVDVTQTGFAEYFLITDEKENVLFKIPFELLVNKGNKAINAD